MYWQFFVEFLFIYIFIYLFVYLFIYIFIYLFFAVFCYCLKKQTMVMFEMNSKMNSNWIWNMDSKKHFNDCFPLKDLPYLSKHVPLIYLFWLRLDFKKRKTNCAHFLFKFFIWLGKRLHLPGMIFICTEILTQSKSVWVFYILKNMQVLEKWAYLRVTSSNQSQILVCSQSNC